MKSFEGYLKQTAGDTYLLLAGGGIKPLSDFLDVTTTDGRYVKKTGDTTSGPITYIGGGGGFRQMTTGDTMVMNIGSGSSSSATAGAEYGILQLFHNGTEVHRLYSHPTGHSWVCAGSANFGIGITSPTYKLSVIVGSDVWHAQFGTSGGRLLRIGGSTPYGSVIGSYNTNDNSSPASLSLLRDGGNVGIGIANPSYKLHINGTTFMTQTCTIAENLVALEFRPNHASYKTRVQYMSNGNEALVFSALQSVTSFIFKCGYLLNSGPDWASIFSSSTPTMQLKGQSCYINGFIGDGTNPSYNFYVGGSSYFSGLLNINSDRFRICTGTSGLGSPLRGTTLPGTSSNWVGIFARPGWSTDEGGILLSEDTCIIYNSHDTGWGFCVHDTDLNLSDWSSGTMAFGVNASHLAWSLSGYINGSDERLKFNIKEINDESLLPLKQFNRKSDGVLTYGFIALELEAIGHSELVVDGTYKSVDYNSALSLCIAQLSNIVKRNNININDRINLLEKRVLDLELENQDLKERLNN